MNHTLQALFGAGGNALSASGRNGDSVMAYLSPRAAATLKRAGGAGTTNPATGAREFYTQDQLGAAQNGIWNTTTMGAMPAELQAIYNQALGLPAPQPRRAVEPPAPGGTSRYGAPSDVQGIWDGMTDDQRTGVLRGIGWNGGIDDSLNAWAGQNASTFENAFRNWANGGAAQQTATPVASMPATTSSRYAAPTDIQALWDLMTPQQQQNAVKQAGWTGGIDDSLNQWVASGNQGAFENAVRANRYAAPTAVQKRWDLMTEQQRNDALSGVGWTGGASNPDLNQWALNNRNAFEGAVMNYGMPRTQTGGLGYGDLNSALTNLSRYFSTQSMAPSNPFGSLSGLYGGSSPFFQQGGSFGSGAGGSMLSSLFGAGSGVGSLFGSSATSSGASATTPSANPFGGSSGAFAKSSRSTFPTQTGLI